MWTFRAWIQKDASPAALIMSGNHLAREKASQVKSAMESYLPVKSSRNVKK
jgi:hypothetical protein